MRPKVDGHATPLGQRFLCVMLVVYWLWASVRIWVTLRSGFVLGFLTRCTVLGEGAIRFEAWYVTAVDVDEVLSGVVEGDRGTFVAEDVKSCPPVPSGSASDQRAPGVVQAGW